MNIQVGPIKKVMIFKWRTLCISLYHSLKSNICKYNNAKEEIRKETHLPEENNIWEIKIRTDKWECLLIFLACWRNEERQTQVQIHLGEKKRAKSYKVVFFFFFFFKKKLTHSQSLRPLPNWPKKILPTFTLKINFPFPLIGLSVIELC